jgi:hypothetical protein
MTTLILCLVTSTVLFLGLLFISQKRKLKKPLDGLSTKAKKIESKTDQEKIRGQYPVFIPFYEWHGFINGLHPENRKWVLSNGKQGVKPNRWK